MNSIEYEINDHCFIHNNEEYDCSFAIEHDIKLIIQEAETSHKDTFDELYDRDSLKPNKIRLFVDKEENPIYGMIIYTIDYRESNTSRYACGNYYPVWRKQLMQHPFQGSICW